MRWLRDFGVLSRVRNSLKFQLELFVLRGPFYRLFAVAVLIALIAVATGYFVFEMGGRFGSANEAIWWAFLRLTDPGYLGDDQGALLRSVSTVVTVLGYVIFLGALVAIMTQWFQQTMSRLEAGLTPIAQKQHVLLLGWTNRTATIVHELFRSEGRVQRFLRRFGTRRLRVVLLCEQEPAVVAQELHDHLGRLWEPARFILRSGTPLRLEHLERVDFLNAAVILLPAPDRSSSGEGVEGTADGMVIKTLMTIADAAVERAMPAPLVVAEIIDPRKVSLARRAYNGPVEVIAGDEFGSRLMAHNVRRPGLSQVYSELLGHGFGNEIYLRECPSLVGVRFIDAYAGFGCAVPIGLVRKRGDHVQTLLNPRADVVIEAGDRLALVAEDYEDALPNAPVSAQRGGPMRATTQPPPPGERRILILGFSNKAASLIRELDSYARESCTIDVVSLAPSDERQALLERMGIEPKRVVVGQIEADFTSPSDLASLDPARYQTIVILASDWLEHDPSTDARTVLGYLVLSELLHDSARSPHILVELLDPDNVGLFRNKPVEVLVSPMLVSHVLTQVALRRELLLVFGELFGPEGSELVFRPLREVAPDASPLRFEDVQRACVQRGELAIGMRERHGNASYVTSLNPKRSEVWDPSREQDVIVLARG